MDKSHKRAQVGSGLGLSIVKSILELHGGRYGVQSKLGKGSIFWFQLERVTETGEKIAPEKKAPETVSRRQNT